MQDRDYVNGQHFVFLDELELSEQDKHMLEAHIPSNLSKLNVFATSAGRFETLTAEPKKHLDGSPYVLIRKATAREQVELFSNEENRPNYEEPENLAFVMREDADKALNFLVAIEPEPSDCETGEEYDDLIQLYEPGVTKAKATLRRFSENINPKTLEHMRITYHELVERYEKSSLEAGVAASYLNEAMHGVGPWEK